MTVAKTSTAMTSSVDVEPAALGPPPVDVAPARQRRSPHRVLAGAVVVAGFAALVATLYAASLHAVVGNSDGATVVLEGQSMSAGNLLLHHWSLSLDSFWSVDAAFYLVAVLVSGVGAVLLHLVPAVIASLVVVTGALLARTGLRGLPAVAAGTTVVAVLALPSQVLAVYFLQGPLHVGTVLWCLLAFAGLRHGRLGWGWAAAVTLLAAGVLGDVQTAIIGMAPALAAGGLAMVRTRHWRGGLTTAAAPVVALALAASVRALTSAAGAFSVASGHPTAAPSRLLPNVGLIAVWGAHMLGMGSGKLGFGGVPLPLEFAHAAAAAVLVAGVVAAATRLGRGVRSGRTSPGDRDAWHLDDLLLLAFVADLCVFVALTYTGDQDFSRYLTAAVVFGAVLAGRTVGRLFAAMGPSPWRRSCAVLGAVLVAAFAAGLANTVAGPQPARPDTALGAFLTDHHLHDGIGDYWSASITTVSTGDIVRVRPVIADARGRIVRYRRQSTGSWYTGRTFGFLVYDTARPWGGVTSASASATFGPTAHRYAVGTFRILVWDHPLSVGAGGP